MIHFLRQLFVQDFWLKLFSLTLAVLIWFAVSLALNKKLSPANAFTDSLAERTFSNQPVIVMSSVHDARQFRVQPAVATVVVQGESRLLKGLDFKDVRVFVDLTGGERAAASRKRIEVSMPRGVSYVSVDPQEVRILPPNTNQ